MMLVSELSEKLFCPKAVINLEEVKELEITCRCILQRLLNEPCPNNPVFLTKIQAVLDCTYEKINIGDWKLVQTYLRKTMTIASYVKVLCTLSCQDRSNQVTEELFRECSKIVDYGILFGCPLEGHPKLLQNAATILNDLFIKLFPVAIESKCESSPTKPADKAEEESKGIELEILDCPSMEYFYKNYILSEKPVILANCINHWPAITKWKDQSYFLKLAGLRTVPIELGSKYTDSEWTQILMTLEEFIKKHIFEENSTTGYLAQYQLFDQIPELKSDISEPEYCCFSTSNEPVDINAWFGPKGTVSPLHYDPKKNLLAQVIGEKHIYLFSPKDSPNLYPHAEEMLKNTAKIDPKNPDLKQYPKYERAKSYHCILKPGQMLFIPPKWWHHVESLSISFSVSFWWN